MNESLRGALNHVTLPNKVLCLSLTAGLLILPAAGALWAKLPLSFLTEFPPRTLYVRHEPFSWFWFWLLSGLVGLVVLPSAGRLLSGPATQDRREPRPLPKYLWPGLTLGAAGWLIAWTRSPAFEAVQHHTFFPLWLSYILVANALAARFKQPPLEANPRRYLGLFLLSSLFWWYFEYLNRFVQNWSYRNAEHFSPAEYFLFATLSFSTVLPAVAATGALVGSWSPIRAFTNLTPLPWLSSRRFLISLTIVNAALLFLLAKYPNALFPFVWLAPTFVVITALELCGVKSLLSRAAAGDFRGIAVWSIAGLICGFFWELWNFGSLAHWVYHVPLVARFYLFEMPALGFAGYLPFGILCGAVIEVLFPATATES